MKSQPKLYKDWRWPAFVERYSSDLQAFATEVCGLELAPALTSAYTIAIQPGSRVTISSDLRPQNMAAISPLAPIAIWRLLFRPESVTIVAVPYGLMNSRRNEYQDVLRAISSSAFNWLSDYIKGNREAIHLGDRYSGAVIRFRSALANCPEALAGAHSHDLFWLMEDAHDIPDACFGVACGSLTEPSSCMALSAHAGARNDADRWFLSATRNDLNKEHGGHWDVIDIDGPAVVQSHAKSV
jgi:hypothetical protein